jgi:hypothetical protein
LDIAIDNKGLASWEDSEDLGIFSLLFQLFVVSMEVFLDKVVELVPGLNRARLEL